jgi:hypothetical protein
VTQSASGLSDGLVVNGKDWRFEKDPVTKKDVDIDFDRDPRTQQPLKTHSFSLSFGLKNAVIDRHGKAENVAFRNESVRNVLRVKILSHEPTAKKAADGDFIRAWKEHSTIFVPPGQWGGAVVGDGLRAILDEMPT